MPISKDLPPPNAEQVSRRAFFGRTFRLAGAGAFAAAAVVAEPFIRPFIDSEGGVKAEGEKPKEGQLSKIPIWANPYIPKPANTEEEQMAEKSRELELKAELNNKHSKFLVPMLKYMRGAEYPEFDRVLDFLQERNGPGLEVNLNQLSNKMLIVLNSRNDETQKSNDRPFVAFFSRSQVKPTQLDVGVYVVSRVAGSPHYQPDSLDSMLEFYYSMLNVIEYSRVAREVGENGGTIDDAVEKLKQRAKDIGKVASVTTDLVKQDILKRGLPEQWGIKTSAQTVLPKSEEAPIPPEISTEEDATQKPVELSDDDKSEPQGLDPEGITP